MHCPSSIVVLIRETCTSDDARTDRGGQDGVKLVGINAAQEHQAPHVYLIPDYAYYAVTYTQPGYSIQRDYSRKHLNIKPNDGVTGNLDNPCNK